MLRKFKLKNRIMDTKHEVYGKKSKNILKHIENETTA